MRRRLATFALAYAVQAVSPLSAATARSDIDPGSFLLRLYAIKHYWSQSHDFGCTQDLSKDYRKFMKARGSLLWSRSEPDPDDPRLLHFPSCSLASAGPPRDQFQSWHDAMIEWTRVAGWNCLWLPEKVPVSSVPAAKLNFQCFPLKDWRRRSASIGRYLERRR